MHQFTIFTLSFPITQTGSCSFLSHSAQWLKQKEHKKNLNKFPSLYGRLRGVVLRTKELSSTTHLKRKLTLLCRKTGIWMWTFCFRNTLLAPLLLDCSSQKQLTNINNIITLDMCKPFDQGLRTVLLHEYRTHIDFYHVWNSLSSSRNVTIALHIYVFVLHYFFSPFRVDVELAVVLLRLFNNMKNLLCILIICINCFT